jgi:hypothetical protein
MNFRISCDESVNIYYMLTLPGTEMPIAKELKDTNLRRLNGKKTDVIEIFGKNSSYVSPVT